MQKINRRDIIDEVSERAHISKKDSENAMRCIIDIVEKSLLEGKEVNITNFGTFVPKCRKKRDFSTISMMHLIAFSESFLLM